MSLKAAAARRPDASREAQKARLIGVALELFAERGYHGTSIPAVMEKAGVGAGTVYRTFENKEALVNAVFRDAKGRLAMALADGLAFDQPPRALFDAFWERLARFAKNEPVAFRFLELQDHIPYLDGESRSVELGVLAPILLGVMDLQRRGILRADVPPDVTIALVWGAFVGLVKAERLGYLRLDDPTFIAARDACWRAIATPEQEGEHHADRHRKSR